MIVVIYYKQKQHVHLENSYVLPIHIILFVHTLCIVNNPLQTKFYYIFIEIICICMRHT